jgi:carotenoid cleavage dioxygenase
MDAPQDICSLEARLAALETQVTRLDDINIIRRLHNLYGYYIDKCLYRETVDLFADNGEVQFFGGIYRGKAGVARLYVERFQKNFTNGLNGPVKGFLLDHMQMQDVIDVAPDGKTAQGRFRAFMTAGRHKDHGGPRQWWEGGLYENEYVKDGGVWKIKVLNYLPQWHADFETGWAQTKPEYLPFPSKTLADGDPLGPDELIPDSWLWPDHRVVPFHCPHPVTGQPVTPEVAAT